MPRNRYEIVTIANVRRVYRVWADSEDTALAKSTERKRSDATSDMDEEMISINLMTESNE